MQNFTLLNSQPYEWRSASLVTSTGEPLMIFERLKEHLIRRGIANETAGSYLGHNSRFIDYCESRSQAGLLLPTTIYDLAIDYEQHLLHSETDPDGSPRHRTSPASLSVIEAALKYFVHVYERSSEIDLNGVVSKTSASAYSAQTNRKIKQHSLLGSVIRGRNTFRDRTKNGLFITVKGPRSEITADAKQFELNKIHKLFESAKTYRDKCFYALLASGGVRTFEAEQLRLHPDHIKASEEKIFVRNPFLNIIPGLTPDERERLHWKGRDKPDVFLVSPWKEYFFRNLDDYLTHEYDPNVDHDFLFQTAKGPRKGRPLFTRCRSSKIDNFDAACKRAGIKPIKHSKLHSLRHSYGDYTLNYIPTANGLGLPSSYVTHNLGHKDSRYADRYAKLNIEKMNSTLRESDALLGSSEQIDIDSIRIQHHEREIQRIKNKKTGNAS